MDWSFVSCRFSVEDLFLVKIMIFCPKVIKGLGFIVKMVFKDISLHQSSFLFNAMFWKTLGCLLSREYMTYKSYLSLNVGSKCSHSKSECISLIFWNCSLDFGFILEVWKSMFLSYNLLYKLKSYVVLHNRWFTTRFAHLFTNQHALCYVLCTMLKSG